LELALGYLDLVPSQFWDMTIGEINNKYLSIKKVKFESFRELMSSSYYAGLFSKIDHKKYTISRWMFDLLPEEERIKVKKQEFIEAKKLWDSTNH
jgi:hypothetical protein